MIIIFGHWPNSEAEFVIFLILNLNFWGVPSLFQGIVPGPPPLCMLYVFVLLAFYDSLKKLMHLMQRSVWPKISHLISLCFFSIFRIVYFFLHGRLFIKGHFYSPIQFFWCHTYSIFKSWWNFYLRTDTGTNTGFWCPKIYFKVLKIIPNFILSFSKKK